MPVKINAPLALGMLTLVYGVNYVDRQLLGLLLQPIKEELQLSDSHLAFLSGAAFALFYTTLGVPLARLAGRRSRVPIISICVGVFSVATAACAFVVNFWQLFLARVIVGIGEAGTSPASHALISDMYPEHKRSGALAVISIGAQLGVLVGFILAGVIATQFGWRAAFLTIGLPGVLIGGLTWLLVREQPVIASEQRPIGPTFQSLWRQPSFRWLCAAGAMILFSLNATNAFSPAFFERAHGFTTAQVGILIGLGVGGLGVAGTLTTGFIANRLGERDIRWPLWMAAVTLVFVLIFKLATYWAPTGSLAGGLFLPALMLDVAWQGPLLAMIQSLARRPDRAMASATFMLIANMIGITLGPQLVGGVSDIVGGANGEGLRLGLSLSLFGYGLGAIFLVIAAVTLRRDLDSVERA